MENENRIATLIFKYIRKDLTVEESGLLQAWIDQSDKHRIFFEEVIVPGHLFAEAQHRDGNDRELNENEAWRKLLIKGIPGGQQPAKVIPMRKNWYVGVAVAVLLFMFGSILYLALKKEPAAKEIAVVKKVKEVNDIAPATRNATLTLANGKVVVLDSLHNGMLASEGSATVLKGKDGQIIYALADSNQAVVYNTISVPRGSNVVHITLTDGTQVWLNAASTLHYPVVFTGGERKVQINGEAYFEVAHNAAAPFKVTKGDMEVTVLGTHFNVNAYDEEDAIKVTLLQGSVKVSLMNPDGIQEKRLAPGQQAVVNNKQTIAINSDFDEEAVMAWKNGLFYFDHTNVELAIRQIERWYDVSINYDASSVKNAAVNGQISRYSNVSEVLDMLQRAEALRFRIKDRKIYISPY